MGYIQAFENIEIFKVKLRWNKSSRLLQREAFLVDLIIEKPSLFLKKSKQYLSFYE